MRTPDSPTVLNTYATSRLPPLRETLSRADSTGAGALSAPRSLDLDVISHTDDSAAFDGKQQDAEGRCGLIELRRQDAQQVRIPLPAVGIGHDGGAAPDGFRHHETHRADPHDPTPGELVPSRHTRDDDVRSEPAIVDRDVDETVDRSDGC